METGTPSTLQRRPVRIDDTELDTVVLGEGPPTVVFLNGLGTPLEEWSLVAPEVARRCRVVCYDRRAVSAKGPQAAHDSTAMAADLRQLLDALGVTGPLVLVGHSWGGATARRFISDFPKDVTGLVLVDASHENIKGMIPGRMTRTLYTTTTIVLRLRPIRSRLLRTLGFGRLAPEVLTAMTDLPWLARGLTARAEFAATGPSLLELGRSAPDLPDLPTRVLLAGGRNDLASKLGAKQLVSIRGAWDKAVAGRSHVRLDVVPDSGHYISLDQPEAVIEAIEDVLGQLA